MLFRSQYFCVYPSQYKKLCEAFGTGTTLMFDAMTKCWGNNAFHSIRRKDFSTDWLFYFSNNDHMIYGLDKYMPWSKPYRICYIGGITNQHYKLFIANEILKASPYVWDIQEIEIPYYNREDNCTRSIEFSVQLPQAMYNRIVRWAKKKYNKDTWMCEIAHCFTPHWEHLDILKLKEALRPDREVY